MAEFTQKTPKDGFKYKTYLDSRLKQLDGLVFVFHGRGSSMESWTERCRQLRKALPRVGVIAVQANREIYDEENGKAGYAWLNIPTISRLFRSFASHAVKGLPVRKQINHFITQRCKEYGLEAKNVAVVGSSAGGIVGIQSALVNKENYGAVLGLCTTVLPFTRAVKKHDKPLEVNLFIGKEDSLFYKPGQYHTGALKVIFNKLGHDQAVYRLHKKGVEVHEKIYDDLEHDVSNEMWGDAIRCISGRLKTQLSLNGLAFAKSEDPNSKKILKTSI